MRARLDDQVAVELVSNINKDQEKLTEEITKTLKDLTVAGDTILGDVVISGGLNVGTLNINTDNSINAAGVLKLQPLALDGIEFLGGLVRFDTEGNIVIQKGVILGNESFRGSVAVAPGKESVRVEAEWSAAPASITVTPTWGTSAWVENVDETGFTVRLGAPPAEE